MDTTLQKPKSVLCFALGRLCIVDLLVRESRKIIKPHFENQILELADQDRNGLFSKSSSSLAESRLRKLCRSLNLCYVFLYEE